MTPFFNPYPKHRLLTHLAGQADARLLVHCLPHGHVGLLPPPLCGAAQAEAGDGEAAAEAADGVDPAVDERVEEADGEEPLADGGREGGVDRS